MAITGKLKIQKSDRTVEKMSVGSSGFIDILDFIVTPKAVFISVFNSFLDEGNPDDMAADGYASIRRTGPGLTQDDFDINVTNIDPEYYLEINTMAVYYDLIKEKDSFIIFYKFQTEDITETTTPEKETLLEKKNRELLEAEKNENYEKAAALRDEISKMKSSKVKRKK